MMTRIGAAFLVLTGALGIVVLALPASLSVVTAHVWAVISVLSAGAIVYGTRRYRPVRRAPWWLLAAAVLSMGAGDVIYAATVRRPGQEPPVVDDVFYLAMFPLLTAGLIMMTRTGAVLRDRSRLLDLLAFGCSAALVAWAFLVGPAVGAKQLGGDAAYTIGDLLVLVAM